MTEVQEAAERSQGSREYNKILVGYDGSENAKIALARAIGMARDSEGELTIVVAADTMGYVAYSAWLSSEQFRKDMLEHAKNLLSEGINGAKQAGITKADGSVNEGYPADVILAHASEQKADLIVLGRRGIRGIGRLLMGSVSSSVISHSECDVLVVVR
jgi:nucleotide-binding universal stress UspA family protein